MKFFAFILIFLLPTNLYSMTCVDRLESINQFYVLKDRTKSLTSEAAVLSACEENMIADLVMAKKFRESRLAPVKAELHKHKKLKKSYPFNPYFKKGESKVSVCNWKGKVRKEDIELIEIYLEKDYDSAPVADACRFVGLSVFRKSQQKTGPGKR